MLVRKGSTAESTSMVSLPQLQIIRYWPQIARDATGAPLISADLIALISQPRVDSRGEAPPPMFTRLSNICLLVAHWQ